MYDLCCTTLCMICAPQRYVWSVLHNVMYDLCCTTLCTICAPQRYVWSVLHNVMICTPQRYVWSVLHVMYDLCSTTLWSVLHNVMYDLCSTTLCIICAPQRYGWYVLHNVSKKTVRVPKYCLWPWITNHILPPSVTNFSYCIAVTVIKNILHVVTIYYIYYTINYGNNSLEVITIPVCLRPVTRAN